MPHETLKRLLINIETSNKIHERLLEVAERKQQHLLTNDVDGLRDDLQDEQGLATDGAHLNVEREELHALCLRRLQAPTSVKKLEQLCAIMPGEWPERFGPARARLRSTVEKLRDVNRMNMVLVNNSIDLMQGLLGALYQTEAVPTYGRRGGQYNNRINVRTLDTKA
jgi:FlgN protein